MCKTTQSTLFQIFEAVRVKLFLLSITYYILLYAVVNWGLEGTLDIMVTPKLGVATILCLNFIIWNPSVLGAGRLAPSLEGFRIKKVQA